MNDHISKTAIVKNSILGEGNKIWEYVNIYGSNIGNNCNIGSYVEIQDNTCIGNGVTVSSHSFIS